MLKIFIFLVLGCLGLILVIAGYVAWRITKMGQSMGRRTSGPGFDYIPTTGETISDTALEGSSDDD